MRQNKEKRSKSDGEPDWRYEDEPTKGDRGKLDRRKGNVQ